MKWLLNKECIDFCLKNLVALHHVFLGAASAQFGFPGLAIDCQRGFFWWKYINTNTVGLWCLMSRSNSFNFIIHFLNLCSSIAHKFLYFWFIMRCLCFQLMLPPKHTVMIFHDVDCCWDIVSQHFKCRYHFQNNFGISFPCVLKVSLPTQRCKNMKNQKYRLKFA
jgi:hypothetical protein